MDAGTDAGSVDAGSMDAGSMDAGSRDAGSMDAGPIDSGVADAGTKDAGADAGIDAGVSSGDGGMELFITSMWYGGNLGGTGGTVAADENCQLAAQGALRGGTWKAWLGTSTVPAVMRIAAVGPWSQSFEDGGREVVFAGLPDGGAPLSRIRVNERGSTSFYYAPAIYWTGNVTPGPVSPADTCSDFTEGDNFSAMTGVANVLTSDWTATGTKPCYWFNALLCFQQSHTPPAPALGPAHKRLFITRATYPGDMGGRAGADTKCTDAAHDAGMPGSFLAYLGTADAGPAARFTTGGPWYQDFADGGSLLTFANGANVATTPRVAIRADELGRDRPSTCSSNGDCTFWTGGVGAYEVAYWTCADWTTSVFESFKSTAIGRSTADDPKWTNYMWSGCSNPHTLLCLQQ